MAPNKTVKRSTSHQISRERPKSGEPNTAASKRQTGSKSAWSARTVRKPSASSSTSAVRANTKQAKVVALLSRSSGTTITTVMQVTGWQAHSVRGFFAGVVRRKLGLKLTSDKTGSVRVYRIVAKRSPVKIGVGRRQPGA